MCKHELALKHKGRAKQKQGKGKGKKKLGRDQSNEGGARSASRAQSTHPQPKKGQTASTRCGRVKEEVFSCFGDLVCV